VSREEDRKHLDGIVVVIDDQDLWLFGEFKLELQRAGEFQVELNYLSAVIPLLQK
jgi:uncharacterized protein YneR